MVWQKTAENERPSWVLGHFKSRLTGFEKEKTNRNNRTHEGETLGLWECGRCMFFVHWRAAQGLGTVAGVFCTAAVWA
jgi:hypothetical protein